MTLTDPARLRGTTYVRRSRRFQTTCALVLALAILITPASLRGQSAGAGLDSAAMHKVDSAARYKNDSAQALKTRVAFIRDSTVQATRRAIALRDTINNPRPPRPEQIRAERREHLLAAGAVVLLASLTFLLYNLRTH